MKLSELIKRAGIEISINKEWKDIEVTGISDHSQRVSPGNCFVAMKGQKVDSHLFLSDAVERRAGALVVDRDIPGYKGVATIKVADTREVLGRLAHTFYNNPSQDMLVIGITGTNGKTTTSYLLESIFKAAGKKVGVIGTVEYRFDEERRKALTTTPSALELARLLSQMKQRGVEVVVMEVSSHSIAQKRIVGMKFDVGVFTNISQDHLDYHRTIKSYIGTKRSFFTHYLAENKNATGVFNFDDPRGEGIHKDFAGPKVGYAVVAPHAEIRAEDYQSALVARDSAPALLDNQSAGLAISLRISMSKNRAGKERKLMVYASLSGEYNVYNVLAATATSMVCALDDQAIQEGLWNVRAVPGRFELVDEGQPFPVIVDYAHTPEALRQALISVRKLCQEEVITVFGCGGERDREKRLIMGQVVGTYSDRAIITNDNPRGEDPVAIAAAIEAGIRSLPGDLRRITYEEVILDRFKAIEVALNEAQSGDLVYIAGKGHEDYQIMGNKVCRFDDRQVARKILKKLKALPARLANRSGER